MRVQLFEVRLVLLVYCCISNTVPFWYSAYIRLKEVDESTSNNHFLNAQPLHILLKSGRALGFPSWRNQQSMYYIYRSFLRPFLGLLGFWAFGPLGCQVVGPLSLAFRVWGL